MAQFGRLVLTGFIWLMVPASLSVMHITSDAAQAVTVLILALAAMGTTGFLWLGHAGAQHETAHAEKAKRGASARLDRLVNSLDEDDLAELRARLLASDGEAPVPLDSLLGERRR